MFLKVAEGELQGDHSVEQAAEEAESETADLKRFCEVDVWTVSSSAQFCALLSKRKTYALREKSELVRYALTLRLSGLSVDWSRIAGAILTLRQHSWLLELVCLQFLFHAAALPGVCVCALSKLELFAKCSIAPD